jgi:acyl dehydratase
VFLHADRSFRAPVSPGDRVTGRVEVIDGRDDKPITTLRTVITNQAGVTVGEGTAVTWTEQVS